MLYKKIVAGVAAVALLANISMTNAVAYKGSVTNQYDNEIGMGINYTKQTVIDGSVKKVLNIISCDLENSGANITFSKAKDVEKKSAVLSKQVQRENYKGNNVVAAINGDMFDMGIGYSSGPQIRDGAILTNHNAKSEENIYPVFGIDNNKKAFISYIHMNAKITLGSTTSSAINLTPDGTLQDPYTMPIDAVNRENCRDKIVLIDYRLNQSKKIDISPYITQSTSNITLVKGITGPLKLGQEYEGTIEKVGGYAKTADIPTDGVLLCGTGAKAKWMNANFKAGAKIKVQVNYDRNDIREAIGAYSYFVQNGRVLSNDEMIKGGAKAALVNARKARTAVGITAQNKVIAITVDGGGPSKGISDGITLHEMATLLKSMGAVNAVAFDGGGSTQMNAKLYGESSVSILTKPSDGRERAVTNGIMFVSNNERTYKIKSVSIDGTGINIFRNTTYKFKAKGMDDNFNRLDLSNASINWVVDSNIGKIDKNGNFTAGDKTASGKVTANVGTKPASANIRVFSTLPALKLTDTKTVAVQKGVMRQFRLDARDSSGNAIIIGNAQAKWSVTGSMGTIDKNGLLTVTAKAGSGVVTAEAGGKKASVAISIMPDCKLIDDFEHNDIARYLVDGTIGGEQTISSEQAKSGLYSYKLNYDYALWDKNGTGNIIIMPTFIDKNSNDTYANYTSASKPKKIGLWLYGDGKAPLLGAQFSDSDGNNRTVTIAKSVNWTGWKYVTADIPTDIPSPMTLESLYFQESVKNVDKKGTVYIDDVKYIYSDTEDNMGPTFSEFYPSGKVFTNNVGIRVKIADPSGVETRSIWASLDGMPVPAVFDENTGILTYDAKALKTGAHTFEVKAMDKKGNSANPAYVAKFTISLEADTTKPVIDSLVPGNKGIVRTQEPRISVRIKDDKSGINASDVNIVLDGAKLKSYFDESSGYASAAPLVPLSVGTHKISVLVKDRSGNKAELSPTSFTVKSVVQPKDPNNFSVSVLSDSHATEFGSRIFEEAGNNDSELIIQNGDLVDKDTSTQWTEAFRQLGLLKNKQYMVSPGNHEASAGGLTNFNRNFGTPTYSFSYGNSLFISLNSSIGQGISASDPTQFDYLQDVLDRNTRSNVFIYTHVPTRDSAGIGHALPEADGKKLEGILTSYKKKNSNKNINVIFGHMHTFQSWSVGGVNYAIDGNECLKKYVSPDAGGYMGYTKFVVNGTKVTMEFVPMPDSFSIVDSALVNGEMKIIRGGSKKLNVYGDFSYSTADYIAILNNIKNVGIEWESENPDIIGVSPDGTISAKAEGSAVITAKLNGMSIGVKVTAIEPLDEFTAGFKAVADANALKAMTAGKKLKLNTYGYDIYGNSFSIGDSQVFWSCSAGSITNGEYTAPAILTADTPVTLTAVYKNHISKIDFTVKMATATKTKHATITAASLNIRSTPSANGNIIGKLNKGDRVDVLGEENGWLLINVNDIKGYISKEYTAISEN